MAAGASPCAASPGIPARFDGTIIEPTDKISWPAQRWTRYIDSIYRSGHKSIILAWSARNGRALYPSAINRPYYDRGVNDIVGLILSAADAYGMEVYLGLDGTVDTSEFYDDLFDRAAKRCNGVTSELFERYSQHPSLRGFLIPQQGTGYPRSAERAFYRSVSFQVHRTGPGMLVLARMHLPAYRRQGMQGNPALIGIRMFNNLLNADYEKVEQALLNNENFNFWIKNWKRTLLWDGPDVILFEDGLGSRTRFFNMTRFYLDRLRGLADEMDMQLWAVTELYDLTRRPGDMDPPQPHPLGMQTIEKHIRMESEFADRLISFSFDYMDPGAELDTTERTALHGEYINYLEMFYPASLGRSVEMLPYFKPSAETRNTPDVMAPTEDELLGKAIRVEEIMHGNHDLEGQVITYRDLKYHLDHPYNGWQEDACWLTGIYAAAESFRYAVTRDPDARELARRSWLALHKMANVTPEPGVVVRCFNRSLYGFKPGPPGNGRKKYWHKDPDREMYYIADISRDQLSGYFIGLAAYYDLVADESEKEIIRTDTDNIMRLIIDNGMKAKEFTGWDTTYGDLTTSPIIGLNMLLVAHHITGKEEYRKKYLELVRYERWMLRAIEGSAVTFNHFFEHFDDSSYYHAVQYEPDPELATVMVSGLDFLYTKAHLHGNGHLLLDVATYRPWSDAAALGLSELMRLPVEQLYIGEWAAQPPYTPLSEYVPIEKRRIQEYMWCWFPGGNAMQGGVETEFSGVGYLLAYWMGRYHRVIH